MNHPLPLLRRRAAAALAATGLLVGGFAAVAAPAQAAQTGEVVGGTASWGVSTYLNAANFGRPNPIGSAFVAPATFDDTTRIDTWGGATGTVGSDGSADLAFAGSSVNYTTTSGSFLKLADLQVDVDASGNGTVSALVSYGTVPGSFPITYDPAASPARPPARVDMVDLVGNAPTDVTVTDGSALFSALDGTWSPDFIDYLDGDATAEPAVPGFAYVGQINSNADRTPLPFTFAIDRAEAATTVAGSSWGNTGASFTLTGTGFAKTAPGVYLSLRESAAGDPAYAGGALPADAPTVWISNDPADIGPDPETGAGAAIAEDGSFTATLGLTPEQIEALDPAKVHTLVTRKAHGQGGIPAHADQITEIPVEVEPILALAEDYDLTTTSVQTSPSLYGAPSVLEVDVDGGSATPTGAVQVRSGDEVLAVEQLTDGAATLELDGLPVGANPLTVAYEGDDLHWASATDAVAVVQKSPTITTIDTPAASTYGKPARVVVKVSGGAGSVTLTGAGAARTGTLVDGVARFALPADLAPKAYALTATYAGDAGTTASGDTATLEVAKAEPGIRVSWTKKPTAKKAGKLTVVLSGPAAVAAPAGKVSAVLKSGGTSVKVTAKALRSGKVALTVPKLKAGTWKATVTYAGQGGFAKVTKSVTAKVKKK